MSDWNSIRLGIVRVPCAFLYGDPDDASGPQTDEVLSGWAVSLTGEAENGWLSVRTHYGYPGWIRESALLPADRAELSARQASGMHRVASAWADLYTEPTVKGGLMTSLPRGSFVLRTEDAEQNGWTRVSEASGLRGWVHSADLAPRRDDDLFLLEGLSDPAWFRKRGRQLADGADEASLRMGAVRSALAYLGSPYRWGGKTPAGIDCSGMTFMSWLENGILIYRDADIRPEYPLTEIDRGKIREGDLIFFPGHVGLYLGNGKYIHATAYSKTPWVTINSLNPADPDYREDLAASVTACGSVFAP